MDNSPCVRGAHGITENFELNTVVRVSGDTPVVVSQLACYVPREGFVVPVRTRNIIDLDGHMAPLAWLRRLRRLRRLRLPRLPYTRVPDHEFGEWQIRICISKLR